MHYPIHEDELLVIIHALRAWRHYLSCCDFKIKIDYQTLWYLTSQASLNQRQSHWIKFMQVFNFEIQYIKGIEIVMVDFFVT